MLLINLKCLCFSGIFCHWFIFMYINLCLFENVLLRCQTVCMVLCVLSAFRCAYCYFLNPARKTRPQAPRLPEVTGELKMSSEAPLPSSGADVDDNQSVLGDNDIHIFIHTSNIPLQCNSHAYIEMLPLFVHVDLHYINTFTLKQF